MAGPALAAKHDHDHEPHFDETADVGTGHEDAHANARDAAGKEALKDEPGPEAAKAPEGPAAVPAEAAAEVDPDLGKKVMLGGVTHVVGKGDSLWSLAAKTYGSGTFWTKIKAANKGKVHGADNIIIDGDELVLPELEVGTLDAMKGLDKHPEELRDLACAMTDEEYQAFIGNLPQKDKDKYAHLLQMVEMMRSTGMTFEEMAADQKQFLEDEAAKKGVSVGDYIKDIIAKKGYGGATAVEWNKNDPAQKKAWHERFKTLIATVKSTAPADVKAIITDAEKKGGGFSWDPEKTEELGAFAYTAGDWKLHCGTRFVEVGEGDSSVVYANISHEMGGHNYYGDELGSGIQQGAMDALPEEERDKAVSGGNSMFSTYGYPETEIFAELYEYRYDSDKNPTDHPFDKDPAGNAMPKRVNDVKDKLGRIKELYSPTVAEGLVHGLALRVEMDAKIMPEAKELFRADVKTVFGFDV